LNSEYNYTSFDVGNNFFLACSFQRRYKDEKQITAEYYSIISTPYSLETSGVFYYFKYIRQN